MEAAKSRTGGGRGGAEDGGRSGRPRWLRIRRATARSVMEASLIAESWRGVHSKADFQTLQSSEEPLVESMRR